jgi:DNA replication and repair protein RecF
LRVDALALEDFRNYVREDVELAPGLNLITGRNAQGKTNLLEAIHYLGGLGSPRAPDSALVRTGAERSLLHAQVVRRDRPIRIDLELRPGRGARVLINKTPASGPRALRELVVSVFFGPDELSLVKGSPDARRRFLDELVVKLRPARDSLRRESERVLKQRNALLKSAPRRGELRKSAEDTIGVWDDALSRTGAALTAARLEALAQLAPHARSRYVSVAGGGNLSLRYASSWIPDELVDAAAEDPASVPETRLRDELAARIEEVRPRELERGVSLVGPQRDDVTVVLGEGDDALDARTYASQGDQRTAALALKLAEHDLLTDALDEPPVLLLDDVFSELDPARREWLAESVSAAGQTILSSADAAGGRGMGVERVIEIAQGKVLSA